MSSYTAINDAGESLKTLVETAWGNVVTKPTIVFDSPKEITVSSSGSTILSLFLFDVMENPHLKNREPIELSPQQVQHPPLALDLLYLITPFANNHDDEKKMIGRLMQILHSYAVIPESCLQGSLTGEIRVLFHSFSLDDLTKIWTSFQEMPYRFSVGYMVTPVFIDSLKTETLGPRVVDKVLTSKYVKKEKE